MCIVVFAFIMMYVKYNLNMTGIIVSISPGL